MFKYNRYWLTIDPITENYNLFIEIKIFNIKLVYKYRKQFLQIKDAVSVGMSIMDRSLIIDVCFVLLIITVFIYYIYLIS